MNKAAINASKQTSRCYFGEQTKRHSFEAVPSVNYDCRYARTERRSILAAISLLYTVANARCASIASAATLKLAACVAIVASCAFSSQILSTACQAACGLRENIVLILSRIRGSSEVEAALNK